MSMPTGGSTAGSGSLQQPGEQPCLARLVGAASLRRELEGLLSGASPMASTSSLRELALKGNAVGKKSASAARLAWKRLEVRYVLDPRVPEYRAFLTAMDMSGVYEDRGSGEAMTQTATSRARKKLDIWHMPSACQESPRHARRGSPPPLRWLDAVLVSRVSCNQLGQSYTGRALR